MTKKLGIILKQNNGFVTKKVYEADTTDTLLSGKQNTLSSGQLANINADHSQYLTSHQDISGKLDTSTYNADKATFQTKTDTTISGTEKNLVTVINDLLSKMITANSNIATLQSSLNAVGITHIVADVNELNALTATAKKGEMALQVDDKTLHIYNGTAWIQLADNVGATVDISTKQNIAITDANNHFTATTVEGVFDELYNAIQSKQNSLSQSQLAVTNGDVFNSNNYYDKNTSDNKYVAKADQHDPTFLGVKTDAEITQEFASGSAKYGDWYEVN